MHYIFENLIILNYVCVFYFSKPSSGPSIDGAESMTSTPPHVVVVPPTPTTDKPQQQPRPQPKIVIKPGTKPKKSTANTPHVNLGPTKITLGSIKKQKSLDQSSTSSSVPSTSNKSSKV